MTKSRSENELELKISLSGKNLEKVFSHFSARLPKTKIRHKYLPRRYYDTVNLDFQQRGISLRVQYKKGIGGKLGSFEQTVKMEQPPDKSVADALQRRECKNLLSGRCPDLASITDAEVYSRVKNINNSGLVHIFTASIERRYFNAVSDKKGQKGVVELAFDAGEITVASGGKGTKFFEIEIERKRGSAKAINAIRDKILAIAPSAKIQKQSKADIGGRLFLKCKQNK